MNNAKLGLFGVLLVGLVTLSACSDRSEPSAGAEAPAKDTTQLAAPGIPEARRAMRIKSELTVRVADVDAATSDVRGAVKDLGGYVARAQSSGEEATRRADLELKVPSDKLAALRTALVDAGSIESESETAEDVTDQQADLKARVRNAHAEEKRLLDLLSDKTGSLADVIAAEKALSEVRERVERLEAADAALDGQIAYADVKLHLTPKRVAEPSGAIGKVGAAFERGFSLLGQALIGAGVLFGTFAPTLLVFGLLLAAFVWATRVISRRRASRSLPHAQP